MRLIDLTGQVFGKLTVLHRDPDPKKTHPAFWFCQCECGNVKSISSPSLRREKEPTRSCGCSKEVRLEGEVFGRLTVLRLLPELNSHNQRQWECLCECGSVKITTTNCLRSGVTVSCGCHRDRTGTYRRHGLTDMPEYKIWISMKQRCKRDPAYLERSITICPEWENSFEQFIQDVGVRPTERHQLDRINPFEGYKKENVRWQEGKANLRNKTSSRMIEFRGEVRCLSEWAEMYGMGRATLRRRLEKGWDVEKAITAPIESKPSKEIKKWHSDKPPEYRIWLSIKSRCRQDPNYVSKNIKVYPEWEDSFESFYSYLTSTIGLRPTEKHQLDRINPYGNYEPLNLRWLTAKENSRNTTKNRIITYEGKSQSLAAWAEEKGMRPGTLRRRLVTNWSIDDALNKPLRKR